MTEADSTHPKPADSALFSHRSFARFWCSRLCTTSGMQMLMVALGWQMYDLTGSAWDLGLVGLVQFAPALALALPAGHVIDTHDRRHVLTACIVLQGVVALVLLAAAHWDFASRNLILGVSVLLGAARAFQMPAQQAMTPLLVPVELLPRALASSSAAMQSAIIVAPAVGGFVYAFGADAVYALCAVLFVMGGVLVAGIVYDHRPAPREPVTMATLLAGVHYIRGHRALLGAISLDLFAVLLGGATALLPIFAKDVLHTGPWGLGLLRSAPAVGALLVSAALSRWPIERRVGRIMYGAVAVYGVTMLVFGLSESFVLSLIALFISGGADMVSVVIRQSLVQLDTPDAMRGRVSAVNSIFIGASNQLGEFESGVTAALLGPVGSVVLGGVGTLAVVGLWIKLFPELTTRERLRNG